MSIETDIMGALFARAATFTALPIAWPNKQFDIPADGKYVSVFFIPNTTTRILIASDGPQRHIGILQLNVMWPLLADEEGARAVAGNLVELFSTDLKMIQNDVAVRVTKRPVASAMIVSDRNITIPVSVEYEVYA